MSLKSTIYVSEDLQCKDMVSFHGRQKPGFLFPMNHPPQDHPGGPRRATERDPRGVTSRVNTGFTLVEMLAVLVIILILTGLVVPPITSLLRSLQITQGGNLVSGQLDLARQLAVSQDQTISVRLIIPSGSTHFSAIALLKTPAATTAVPSPTPVLIDKPVILPDPIIMDTGTAAPATTLSTLTQPGTTPTTPATTDPSMGRFGTTYTYIGFSFYPNGATSLSSTSKWFVTVHNITDGDGMAKVPKNYYTVQLDPSSGRTTIFTP